MNITALATTQIESLIDLFVEYRKFYGQARDRESCSKFVKARLCGGDSIIFTASNNSDLTPLGFVQVYPTFSSISVSYAWLINDLFVDAEHRRLGIARLLLEAVIERAKAAGVSMIRISTEHNNSAAQLLYETLGFEQDMRFRHYLLKVAEK